MLVRVPYRLPQQDAFEPAAELGEATPSPTATVADGGGEFTGTDIVADDASGSDAQDLVCAGFRVGRGEREDRRVGRAGRETHTASNGVHSGGLHAEAHGDILRRARDLPGPAGATRLTLLAARALSASARSLLVSRSRNTWIDEDVQRRFAGETGRAVAGQVGDAFGGQYFVVDEEVCAAAPAHRA